MAQTCSGQLSRPNGKRRCIAPVGVTPLNSCAARFRLLFWLLMAVIANVTTAAQGGAETPMTTAIIARVEQYPAEPAYVSKIGRRSSGAVDSPEIFIRTVNHVSRCSLTSSNEFSNDVILSRTASASASRAWPFSLLSASHARHTKRHSAHLQADADIFNTERLSSISLIRVLNALWSNRLQEQPVG